MTVYIEPEERSEVNGKAILNQNYHFLGTRVSIKKIIESSFYIGETLILGEEVVVVDTQDEKTKRDLIAHVGEYVIFEPEILPTQMSAYYGSFSSSAIQTITANTEKAVTFNTTEEAFGVRIGTPISKIIVDYSGVYNIQFSLQVDKTDSNDDSASIWLRKNGEDVSRTTTDIYVLGNDGKYVAAWNFVLSLDAGNDIELYWSSPDSAMRLFAQGQRTGPIRPAVPSAILTVTQIR